MPLRTTPRESTPWEQVRDRALRLFWNRHPVRGNQPGYVLYTLEAAADWSIERLSPADRRAVVESYTDAHRQDTTFRNFCATLDTRPRSQTPEDIAAWEHQAMGAYIKSRILALRDSKLLRSNQQRHLVADNHHSAKKLPDGGIQMSIPFEVLLSQVLKKQRHG